MSAGFNFAQETYWGTNGAIEAYLEALAEIAAERFGPDDRLATTFAMERAGYYTGKIVFLDDILTQEGDRKRFVELLDLATDKLFKEQAFTDYGREWVAMVIPTLRDRIVPPGPLAFDS